MMYRGCLEASVDFVDGLLSVRYGRRNLLAQLELTSDG